MFQLQPSLGSPDTEKTLYFQDSTADIEGVHHRTIRRSFRRILKIFQPNLSRVLSKRLFSTCVLTTSVHWETWPSARARVGSWPSDVSPARRGILFVERWVRCRWLRRTARLSRRNVTDSGRLAEDQ